MQRLYKDRQHRMIGGVCSGIADYINTDITLIRVITVFLCLLYSPVICVYFFLMIILPDKSEMDVKGSFSISEIMENMKSGTAKSRIRSVSLFAALLAVVIVIVEMFFNVNIKLKYIAIFGLIIYGLYLITTKDFHDEPQKRVLAGAGVCILALAYLAVVSGFLYFPVAIIISTIIGIWPLVLAGVGLSLLMQNKRYVSILWSTIVIIASAITLINALSVLF